MNFMFRATISTQIHDQTAVYPTQSFPGDQSLCEVKKVVIHVKVSVSYNIWTFALLWGFPFSINNMCWLVSPLFCLLRRLWWVFCCLFCCLFICFGSAGSCWAVHLFCASPAPPPPHSLHFLQIYLDLNVQMHAYVQYLQYLVHDLLKHQAASQVVV